MRIAFGMLARLGFLLCQGSSETSLWLALGTCYGDQHYLLIAYGLAFKANVSIQAFGTAPPVLPLI